MVPAEAIDAAIDITPVKTNFRIPIFAILVLDVFILRRCDLS